MSIKNNLEKIVLEKSEIAIAEKRNPEDIILCAVTKTRTAEEINEAINCGITDIGENKVQEILDKYEAVLPVKWHMIGHLQTNKVKYIIDKVSMIHSVDSKSLAVEIDKRAKQHNITMDILIQINSACEESKFGISTEETGETLTWILNNCENIRVRGFMCIAPFDENSENVAVYFREVKSLYDKYSKLNHERVDFKYLSMGMSSDYRVAIREGSNFIRIGTAIFGDRTLK